MWRYRFQLQVVNFSIARYGVPFRYFFSDFGISFGAEP